MRERLTFANKEKYRQNIGKVYILICMMFYVLCNAAKNVFTAETRYIIEIWHLNQAQVQLANSLYYITYAAVQLLLFIFMSKINIKIYTFITIPISALIYMIMGLATRIEMVWVLFVFAGIFQSSMFSARLKDCHKASHKSVHIKIQCDRRSVPS